MVWESVPPASQLHLTCQCVEDLNTIITTLYPDMIFFSSSTTHLQGAATTPATTPWGPPPQPTQKG